LSDSVPAKRKRLAVQWSKSRPISRPRCVASVAWWSQKTSQCAGIAARSVEPSLIVTTTPPSLSCIAISRTNPSGQEESHRSRCPCVERHPFCRSPCMNACMGCFTQPYQTGSLKNYAIAQSKTAPGRWQWISYFFTTRGSPGARIHTVVLGAHSATLR
jgi:hypothetical protein